jgi:hypothetical protein
MKKSLVSFAAALAALLVVGAGAHADSIPWGYSASTPAPISASTSPLSSINFSGGSGIASGSSGIIVYSLTTNSSTTDSAPDSFTNVPFNLAINLTDIKSTGSSSSGAISSGVVNFAGLFNASNVTTKSLLPGLTSFTQVPGNTSATSASLTLGASDTGWNTYTVQIGSFTPPGQPGGAPGSIEAIVTVTPGTSPGGSSGNSGGGDGSGGGGGGSTLSGAPEPASLLLASLGLPLIVLVRRRLKKDTI